VIRFPAIGRQLLLAPALACLLLQVVAAGAGDLREPDEVLDGTDLVPLAEVRQTALPATLEGKYVAEQGGAEIRLSIAGRSGGDLTVTRTYEEPELPAETKEYTAVIEPDGLALKGDALIVRATGPDLIVLETESTADSIPPDYWILYRRAD
jgi:hypothetical protein